MKDHRCKMEIDKYYHVFNRGNNGEKIFYSPENYRYFIKRFDDFLSSYLDVFAFCLLPNHFHFLVKVKEGLNVSHLENVKYYADNEKLLSEQFQAFFTSYSKSINKQEGRTGSLFQKPFKRIVINSENYLTNLVFYIHANPQLHCIIDDFKYYSWSSYNRILNDNQSKLQKNEVIRWFDDKENYIEYHKQKMEYSKIKDLIIEE